MRSILIAANVWPCVVVLSLVFQGGILLDYCQAATPDILPQEWISGEYAEAAFRSADYDLAFRIASDPELASDPLAQNTLGRLYLAGMGTKKDSVKAAHHIQLAAEMGDPIAQGQVGMMYLKGTGLLRNPLKAIEWLEKSAANGNALAYAKLGNIHMQGDGVPVNPSKSFEMALKAAKLGFGWSQLQVAAMYGQGEIVKQDNRESIRWYKMAASHGIPEAAHAACIDALSKPASQHDRNEEAKWCGLWRELDKDAAETVNPLAAAMGKSEFASRGFNSAITRALLSTLNEYPNIPAAKRAADFLSTNTLKFLCKDMEMPLRGATGWTAFYSASKNTIYLNPHYFEGIYSLGQAQLHDRLEESLGVLVHEMRHAIDAKNGFPGNYYEAELVALGEGTMIMQQQVVRGKRKDLDAAVRELGISCSPWWQCSYTRWEEQRKKRKAQYTDVQLVQSLSLGWDGFESIAKGLYPLVPSILDEQELQSHMKFLLAVATMPKDVESEDAEFNDIGMAENASMQLASLREIERPRRYFKKNLRTLRTEISQAPKATTK